MLDFANAAESIKASFQPFFEDTWLGEDVDVNIVYRYLNELKNYHLWSDDTEAKVFSKTQDMGKLTALFKPVMEDYMQLEKRRIDFGG